MKTRIVTSLLMGLIVLPLVWLAGFDFDTRGIPALLTAIWYLFVVVAVFFYPGWEEK